VHVEARPCGKPAPHLGNSSQNGKRGNRRELLRTRSN
jgi:hypothetical protein